jgi:glycosyltransferase involved in cell wall biosynthesis
VPPTLSVCIPTYGPRGEVLRNTLASVLAQIDDDIADRVEVCVSHHDAPPETAAMVSELSDDILYSPTDSAAGFAPNLMRVVALGTGEYCWVFGHDDEMADGALRHVLGLVDRFRGVSGICVNWANFSPDFTTRVRREEAGHYTRPLVTTRYDGLDDVIDHVLLIWGYTSTNVVHRERWLDAVGEVGERASTDEIWPQIRLMSEMARRHPSWVFSPHVVVRNRTASGFMLDRGRRPGDDAKMHTDLIAGMDAVLNDLVGIGTPRRRELMTRMYWLAASGQVVRQIKRAPGADWRSEPGLARAFVKAFWRMPVFWRDAAPWLLVPGAVERRLATRRMRPRAGPRPLDPGACRVRVDAALPAVFASRHGLDVVCTVRNAGAATLVSAGANPIYLSYRWFDPAGALVMEGPRASLPRAVSPGASARVTLDLLTPWDEGEYELRIGVLQEHVRWFEDLDPANGIRVSARVRHPQ